MEINSEIRFGDEKLKQAYIQLDDRKYQQKELKKWLERAFLDLEKNAFCGTQISKKLIPRDYELRYGSLENLWKYDLPNAWRLIYTVKKDMIVVLSIILDWMNHKDYERKFGY